MRRLGQGVGARKNTELTSGAASHHILLVTCGEREREARDPSDVGWLAGPVADHCPWCGEPGTEGDFCDGACLRAYWIDVRAAGPKEGPA